MSMRTKISTVIIILFLLLNLNSALIFGQNEAELDITALCLEGSKERWKKEGEIYFQSGGINVSLHDKSTKIIMMFTETLGRDVRITLTVPPEYIRTSILSNIKTNDNTTVTWQTKNATIYMSFSLGAFQSTNITVSNLDISIGSIRESVHNFWHYVEYNGYSNGTQSCIVIYISKSHPDFEIDNKHMMVQYKTGFFGWYYPIGDTSSNTVYYYVDDMGDDYRVVTYFKSNESSHIKVQAFPGASEGIFNTDSITGTLAHWWLKMTIGAKKMIIDWFGDSSPNIE